MRLCPLQVVASPSDCVGLLLGVVRATLLSPALQQRVIWAANTLTYSQREGLLEYVGYYCASTFGAFLILMPPGRPTVDNVRNATPYCALHGTLFTVNSPESFISLDWARPQPITTLDHLRNNPGSKCTVRNTTTSPPRPPVLRERRGSSPASSTLFSCPPSLQFHQVLASLDTVTP